MGKKYNIFLPALSFIMGGGVYWSLPEINDIGDVMALAFFPACGVGCLAIDFFRAPTPEETAAWTKSINGTHQQSELKKAKSITGEETDPWYEHLFSADEEPDTWFEHLFSWAIAAFFCAFAYLSFKTSIESDSITTGGRIFLLVGSFGFAALGIQAVVSCLKAVKTKKYQESMAVFWGLILGLPAVFLLVLFVVKFFGWTTSAPPWAAVIIVLLIAILFKR